MLEKVYIVESIIKRKITAKGQFFLVKWKGYPKEQSTWEPKENLLYLQNESDQQLQSLEIPKKKRKGRKNKSFNQQKIKKHFKDKSQLFQFNKNTHEKETVASDHLKVDQEIFSLQQPQLKSIIESNKMAILDRIKDENNRAVILLREKNTSEIRQMPQQKAILLFPVEMSLFLQKLVKQYVKCV